MANTLVMSQLTRMTGKMDIFHALKMAAGELAPLMMAIAAM